MTGTRRQHHVWRSYLETWATDAQIFCLQGARIFRSNVANVGVERDFYKLHTLTDADIQGIRLLMSTGPSVATPVLENFITIFGAFGRLKAKLPPNLVKDAELLALLDHAIINTAEDFHAQIEGDIAPIFDAIRRKDLSFYDNPDLCGQFTHFLSLQNLRTKGVRHRALAKPTEIPGFSLERSWNVLTHMMAVHAGGSLKLERKSRPLLLLENNTNLSFITGDQPVVNLLHAPVPGQPPTLLAFYYPVSPSLGVVLDEVEARSGYRTGPVSIDQVRKLNHEIHAAAHTQLFGSSWEVLKSLMTEGIC